MRTGQGDHECRAPTRRVDHSNPPTHSLGEHLDDRQSQTGAAHPGVHRPFEPNEAVEDAVKGLKEELEKYKDMIHQFEKDRDTKYGNLANELKNTSLTTKKLQ